MRKNVLRTGLLALIMGVAATMHADEGMWLFTNPPTKYLKEKYNFDVDQKWLDHLQKSSVRFGGGSGSFVSPNGLVMTNHHVGLDALQKMSDLKGKDFVKLGFLA